MNIFELDEKTRGYINEINKDINNKQKKIFEILLKINESIKSGKDSKEKRDEMFKDIEMLKNQIKENTLRINEVISNPSTIFSGVSDETLYNKERQYKKEEEIILKEEVNKAINELTDALKEVNKKDKIEYKKYDKKLRKYKLGNISGNTDEELNDVENDTNQDEYTEVEESEHKDNQLMVIEEDDEQSVMKKIKTMFSKIKELIMS